MRKIAVLTTMVLASCTTSINAPKNIPGPDAGECLNGYSGMVNIDDRSYLAVHDKKPHHPGDRLSVIRTFSEFNFTVTQVSVGDWMHGDGPSSDLEAVCRVPGTENGFLAVESGQWEGQFGRLFHLELHSDQPAASVIKA